MLCLDVQNEKTQILSTFLWLRLVSNIQAAVIYDVYNIIQRRIQKDRNQENVKGLLLKVHFSTYILYTFTAVLAQ